MSRRAVTFHLTAEIHEAISCGLQMWRRVVTRNIMCTGRWQSPQPCVAPGIAPKLTRASFGGQCGNPVPCLIMCTNHLRETENAPFVALCEIISDLLSVFRSSRHSLIHKSLSHAIFSADFSVRSVSLPFVLSV
jgi:hypothetical protein